MKIKFYIFCSVLAAFVIQSCSKMNDLSDKFLDEGEITYAAKISGYSVLSGMYNVQLYILINSQRIETVRVYWNNYTDSVDIPVGGQTGIFNKKIDNLAEGGYLFQFVSIDEYGNRSLPVEASGEVYGEKFQGNLMSRSINSMKANAEDQRIVLWNSMDTTAGARYTEILYQGQTIKTPVKENQTVIPNYQAGTTFNYRTAYIPATSIDTFYTDYKEYEATKFLLDKSEWKLEQFSDQHDSGSNAAKNAIDGNYTDRWHSTNNPGYPHWLIIDLGGEVAVSDFALWGSVYDLSAGQTVDTRMPSEFQLLGRLDIPVNPDDGTGWTVIGTFNTDINKAGEQLYTISSLMNARYLKFVGTQPGSDPKYMVIGELDAYVK